MKTLHSKLKQDFDGEPVDFVRIFGYSVLDGMESLDLSKGQNPKKRSKGRVVMGHFVPSKKIGYELKERQSIDDMKLLKQSEKVKDVKPKKVCFEILNKANE